jgi:hypothetical protein
MDSTTTWYGTYYAPIKIFIMHIFLRAFFLASWCETVHLIIDFYVFFCYVLL